MRLPKRNGVNGRYYLIHKPDADPQYWSTRISASRTSWTVLFAKAILTTRRWCGTTTGRLFSPINCWSVICPGCR